MIRVIVVGPRREHDIRIPLPDAPDDLFPHGQRGQQFAVMVVEHFVRDAQPPSGLLRFGAATFGQRAASHRLMAGIAIGHGNELDRGAQRAELSKMVPQVWHPLPHIES